MAVPRVLLKFVTQQELIEDAGRHQDSFTGAHRQSEDVVRVGAGVFSHCRKYGLVLILGNLVEKAHLASTARHHSTFGAIGKTALFFEPLFENFLDLSVTEELLEEDVSFQCFILGLAQEGPGILLRVVEVKVLAGELLIVLADRPSVSLVDVVVN